MNDQAHQLRNLKLRASLEDRHTGRSAPYVVALLGSKGGVGNTTIAAQLALALSNFYRVGVVCTGTAVADLAAISGVNDLSDIHDGSSITWREHLKLYGDDVAWSSGVSAGAALGHWAERTNDDADVLVCDCGSWSSKHQPPSWFDRADQLVITTTSDNLALMDTYACIKQLVQEDPALSARLRILVNQVADREATRQSLERLELTCHRFLRLDLKPATCVELVATPALPIDPENRSLWLGEELAQQLAAGMLAKDELVTISGSEDGLRS